jgi:hypothetical protein
MPVGLVPPRADPLHRHVPRGHGHHGRPIITDLILPPGLGLTSRKPAPRAARPDRGQSCRLRLTLSGTRVQPEEFITTAGLRLASDAFRTRSGNTPRESRWLRVGVPRLASIAEAREKVRAWAQDSWTQQQGLNLDDERERNNPYTIPCRHIKPYLPPHAMLVSAQAQRARRSA